MISNTVSTWLQRIGQPESFLRTELKQISDHNLIEDRDRVIDRIAKAIRSGELIAIASDYDVDGINSLVIATDAIRTMGGRVVTFTASRFSGGYGLSQTIVDKVLASGATLLITCDFGSSEHEKIEHLWHNGITCLVIDHHLVPSRPLPVHGFLNPHKPTDHSTFKHMCSAGLTLSVIGGLKKVLGLTDFKTTPYLDLVAMATVADVMPLTGDNRILTRYGLDVISKADRPGLRALLEINKIEPGATWDGRSIGFRLAPAINAPGRLGPPDIIVDLLLEKDITRARLLAAEVKALWDKRRIITDEITEECTKEVNLNSYGSQPAIVIGRDDFGHGIVGISAARLVDKYNVPVCVFGHEGRGSLRGPPGSRLYDALVYCSSTLVKYGGHQAAAGCQVKWSQLGNFRQKFCEFFEVNPPKPEQEPFSLILELDLRDSLLQVCENLQDLEPCGQSNPRPTIQTSGIVKNWKQVKGFHIKFELSLPNGKELSCFQLGNGEVQESLNSKKVTVQGDLRKNTWNGRTKPEMFVNLVTIC